MPFVQRHLLRHSTWQICFRLCFSLLALADHSPCALSIFIKDTSFARLTLRERSAIANFCFRKHKFGQPSQANKLTWQL